MNLLDELLHEKLAAIYVDLDGMQHRETSPPGALLAGSFDPFHDGHLELAQVAEQLLQTETHFELCICNVDKPPLDAGEVQRRLSQFAKQHPIWVTRCPTFAEKAKLFPGTTFVVGADTAERIIAPRYYDGSDGGLHQAFSLIRQRGCRFLVAGRTSDFGEFIELGKLPVPTQFSDLFVEIPRRLFAVEISSTKLRNTSETDVGRQQQQPPRKT